MSSARPRARSQRPDPGCAFRLLARLVRHGLNRGNVLEGPLRDRIADGGNPGCQGQVATLLSRLVGVEQGPEWGMFGQWGRLRNSDSVWIASALMQLGEGGPTGNDLDPTRAFICKNAG